MAETPEFATNDNSRESNPYCPSDIAAGRAMRQMRGSKGFAITSNRPNAAPSLIATKRQPETGATRPNAT